MLPLLIILFLVSRRGATPESMFAALPEAAGSDFYVDVRSMRRSGVLDMLAGSARVEEREYREFVRDTGFDYRHHLDRVAGRITEQGNWFVVEGRFDWDRIRRYAAAKGGRCSNGLCSVPGSEPGRTVSFRALDSGLLAFASSSDPSAANRIGAERGRDYKQPAAAPLWVSFSGPALRRMSRLPVGTRHFADAIASADRALLSVVPDGDNFRLGLEVTCSTSEQAAVLRTQLEQLTGLVKSLIARESTAPAANDLSVVLTAGEFRREDRRVIGRWPLPKAVLASLAGSN